MRSEKSDHQNAIYVLNQGNQPKIVGFDIEKDTTPLQYARLRVHFQLRAMRKSGDELTFKDNISSLATPAISALLRIAQSFRILLSDCRSGGGLANLCAHP